MKLFVLDVDGVMTDGKFIYSKEGKVTKTFGPDDSDGLSLLSEFIQIRFVSADGRGFEISKKRIKDDMGYEIDLISSEDRVEWIGSLGDIQKIIYMGDGFNDYKVFNAVGYGICPHNSLEHVKNKADFITQNSGANRAVAQACIHILKKFFNKEIL